jgi:cystathionine beta-lyase/cystathionine gamma-synthase
MAKSKPKPRRSSARQAGKAPRLGDATIAIRAGEPKHGRNGPVAPAIERTSNFVFADTAEMKRWAEGISKAYIYTRYGNPTLAIAEAKLAALEGAEAAMVTAAARTACCATCCRAGAFAFIMWNRISRAWIGW